MAGLEAGWLGAGAFLVEGSGSLPTSTRCRGPCALGTTALDLVALPAAGASPLLFSHGPLIGMALRLLWLLSCTLLGWLVVSLLLQTLIGLQTTSPSELSTLLVRSAQAQPRSLLAIALGLEASVWLHLVLDGDPMPVEWRRRKRRRARR